MNLRNLKTYVPAKLYKRGLDYFEQDFVEQLTEDAPNRWHALVVGTRDYEVSVNLTKDGTIVGSYCTCPFESDSLCKHEVAVCLAIREYKKENGSTAVDVLTQLKSLKKAELLEILEELAEKQPSVHLYLTERFADPDGMDEEMARRIIRKSASRASRRGFIEWERSDQAVEGVLEVQDYVSMLDPVQDGEQVIRFSLIVIQECGEILEIADDSSGFIVSTIHESAAVIRETMAQWPEKLDGTFVDKMLELLYPQILFELEEDVTDVALELMESVLQWNERGNFADKFFGFIDKVCDSSEMQNKTYDYDVERFRMLQLGILQEQGDEGAIGRFYLRYHRYPKIRKAQVSQALEDGEFDKVIRLCAESQHLDSKLPGLVNDWKKLRFEACEGLGRTAEMIDLAFNFAAEGEKEYFKKLKNLVSSEKWAETVDSLLKILREHRKGLSLYVPILIDEKRNADLLEYCRSHIHEIEMLAPYLLEDYPNEVNEFYIMYIYRSLKLASDRNEYRIACQKIKGFQKAFGAEAAAGLIDELKFMYPKRTALLDELGKIE